MIFKLFVSVVFLKLRICEEKVVQAKKALSKAALSVFATATFDVRNFRLCMKSSSREQFLNDFSNRVKSPNSVVMIPKC